MSKVQVNPNYFLRQRQHERKTASNSRAINQLASQISEDLFRTFLVPGLIQVPSGAAYVIPPVFVSVEPGQAMTVVKARSVIQSGGFVDWELTRNGVAIPGFSGVATPTPSTVSATAVEVNDGDLIGPVVTAINSAPANMSLQIVFVVT